jgi:hypothetical protein
VRVLDPRDHAVLAHESLEQLPIAALVEEHDLEH